jgi:large subunit ribosomal protein L21
MVEQTENVMSFERYAIIQTGGKQYQAIEGKTLAVEKIEGQPGAVVEFSEVLLRKTGNDAIEIGTPYLTKAVKATIVKQTKGPKIIAFRFKRRKKVAVKKGHRQLLTVIRIETI